MQVGPLKQSALCLSPGNAKLLARIQRRVAIEHTRVEIAGQDYPWIRVADPDQLLLRALETGTDGTVEQDPFWAANWRAAIGMDRFLGNLPSIEQQRILELGCGSGRAGIAAALHGAKVVITDAASTALLVCKFNARNAGNAIQVRKLDWRSPDARLGKFPVIVGSDIVYDPKLFPILEPCVRSHLLPGGHFYVSEPQRHTGDRFESWIRAAGWKCDASFVDLRDDERDIRIFHCQLL